MRRSNDLLICSKFVDRKYDIIEISIRYIGVRIRGRVCGFLVPSIFTELRIGKGLGPLQGLGRFTFGVRRGRDLLRGFSWNSRSRESGAGAFGLAAES